MEIEALVVFLSEEVEAREGVWRTLADVETGAKIKPRLGHALEAAERPVAHPLQDLPEDVVGDVRRGLLLLPFLLLFTKEEDTVGSHLRIRTRHSLSWMEEGREGGRRDLGSNDGERRRRTGRRVLVAARLVGRRRRFLHHAAISSSSWWHRRIVPSVRRPGLGFVRGEHVRLSTCELVMLICRVLMQGVD